MAAICYFAASVILIYALTADDDNPLFVPKDRKRFIPKTLSSIESHKSESRKYKINF